MLELNKIHLGDSYKLIKEIPDKSIDCIYTDVPYLLQQGGNRAEKKSSIAKRIVKSYNKLDDANMVSGFKYEILDDFIRISKKINIFLWVSKAQMLPIMTFFDKYKCNFQLMFWGKTNPSPMCNGNWLPDVEYLLYFSKGVKLNDGYEIKSKFYVSIANKSDASTYDHPSIKPLELVTRHLLHTTQPNDIVLDCFSGSGTTCVAAKELGRRFIGIEIDPTYHKISVDRLNGITANGQTSIFTNFETLKEK